MLYMQKDNDVAESLFDNEFLEKLEYLYLVSKKLLTGASRADRRSRKTGSGIEFADFREYVPGDDIRHIDWNLYARLGKLFLRLFEEEEDLYVYLLIDVSASMRLGTPNRLGYALRVAAALAYITLSNLDRVSLLTFSDQVLNRLPPHRGKNNIFKVLRFLENAPEGTTTSLEDSLRTFVHQNSRKGVAIVLTDFFDPKGYEQAFNVLRYYKHETYAIQLIDESEFQTELRGDVELIDHETGETIVTTLTPRLMQAYRDAFEEHCEQVEQFCLKNEITSFRAPIQIPFEDLILDIFRKRGFLS